MVGMFKKFVMFPPESDAGRLDWGDMAQAALDHNNQFCYVDCVAVDNDDEEKNYYDVTFGDGTVLSAISGIHLKEHK